MNYTFSDSFKKICMVLMGIGLLTLVSGFIVDSHRSWSNLLHYDFFFIALGLAVLFFMAVHYAAKLGCVASVNGQSER